MFWVNTQETLTGQKLIFQAKLSWKYKREWVSQFHPGVNDYWGNLDIWSMAYSHWAVANEPSYILLDSCRLISVFLHYDLHSLFRGWHTNVVPWWDTYALVVTVSPEQMFPQSWQASKTFVSGCFGVSSGLIRLISCVASYLYEKALELISFQKKGWLSLDFLFFLYLFFFHFLSR